MVGEEEKIVHDKMFGLGEARVMIMVHVICQGRSCGPCTSHMYACMQFQHKVGCNLCTAAPNLQPCTDHAMERHITESL